MKKNEVGKGREGSAWGVWEDVDGGATVNNVQLTLNNTGLKGTNPYMAENMCTAFSASKPKQLKFDSPKGRTPKQFG